MDSAPNTIKTTKTGPQLHFKPLNQIYNARSDPQNAGSNISAGFQFYKSALLNDKVIFFGKAGGLLKGPNMIRVFDLKNLQWSYLKAEGYCLINEYENYSVCVTEQNEIILCGPSQASHASSAIVQRLLMTESGGMRWIQDQSTSTISCYNYHSSNIIGDKMYVFGGIGQNNTPRDNLYEYSLASKKWNQIQYQQNRPDPRYKHSSCICQNKLFVFGGIGSHGIYLNDIWSLDLKTFIWTKNSPTTKLAPLINGPTSIHAFRQNILIFGGTNANTDENEVISFDTDLNQWGRIDIGAKIPPLGPSSSVLLYQDHEFIISDQNDFYKLSIDLSPFETQKDEELTLKKQMKSIFERNDFYDVKFRVEGKEIPAYKGILVSRSPYFTKMFASGMKESHDQIIDVPNVKYAVYHKLIEFIYCEEIDMSNEIAVDLLKLAHEYSLPALINKCGKCLAKTIKNENFVDLAQLAEFYQAEELQTHLFNYFLDFRKSLLKTHTPQQLPRFLSDRFVLHYA